MVAKGAEFLACSLLDIQGSWIYQNTLNIVFSKPHYMFTIISLNGFSEIGFTLPPSVETDLVLSVLGIAPLLYEGHLLAASVFLLFCDYFYFLQQVNIITFIVTNTFLMNHNYYHLMLVNFLFYIHPDSWHLVPYLVLGGSYALSLIPDVFCFAIFPVSCILYVTTQWKYSQSVSPSWNMIDHILIPISFLNEILISLNYALFLNQDFMKKPRTASKARERKKTYYISK